MINIEQSLQEKFPKLASEKSVLSKPMIKALKALMHEDEINEFIETHKHLKGFEFLDQILEQFDFSYSVSNKQRENIPTEGRAVIIANHPIGSLDGLALLKFVKEIRPDVTIITNDLLYAIEPLRELFIPLDNMTDKSNYKKAYKQVLTNLNNDEAVIIFPAGEVSRIKPNGVKDGKWQSGFLHFVEKTKSPIVPIHFNAKNSAMFYSLSSLFKPFGTLMLVHEMFNKTHQNIHFTIGEPIPFKTLDKLELNKKDKAKLLRKQLYRLPKKGKKPLIETEKSIAHPVDRKNIKKELRQSELLGETADGKKIHLVEFNNAPEVMKEIGRLRELTFRLVEEGTGKRLDLDDYDRYYKHLVLWDEDDLEIAGAYRIGECASILKDKGLQGLYTHTLFDLHEEMIPYIEQSIELGRSFVQPRYWGLRSLDYLWYGIGAYLAKHPETQYMYGPVTLSNSYPHKAKELIVGFYAKQFPEQGNLATAKQGFHLSKETHDAVEINFAKPYKESYNQLNKKLAKLGVKVPTLYKQYSELCEEGGMQFIDFSIDPDFGNCIDGLILVEIAKVKSKKYKRYVEPHIGSI